MSNKSMTMYINRGMKIAHKNMIWISLVKYSSALSNLVSWRNFSLIICYLQLQRSWCL
eukprot:UN04038